MKPPSDPADPGVSSGSARQSAGAADGADVGIPGRGFARSEEACRVVGLEFGPSETLVDRELESLFELMRGGDSVDAAALIHHVHGLLHAMARQHMRDQETAHTLQPTALVNEAVMKLFPDGKGRWERKAHFISVAAKAMRQILVDHERRRRTQKRDPGGKRVVLDELILRHEKSGADLVAVDEALVELAEYDAELARLVDLRFFSGFTIAETAKILGCSPATADRRWRVARAWLGRELGPPQGRNTEAEKSS